MEEIDTLTLRRAAHKRPDAFHAVYDWYAPTVWKQVYQTVYGDREAAKDIVQEVFIRVYTRLHTFKHDAAFSTWLYRITYNCAMTWLKQRHREHTRFLTMEPVSEHAPHGFEDALFVRRLLDTLQPQQRFMLIAREITGLSHEEIAAVMDKNPGAVRTELHRLKKKLQKEFSYEPA
jgi:RNA polymerase sigma-70 factor (ECF subfamily)